jgi:PAS domain S-box-containing protein
MTKEAFEKYQREITERKQAEEALRESEAKLSVVLENIPAILILVDRERRVQMVNKAAAKFAERTIDEMIGLRGGEALRCVHSLDDPQGCGYGPFCESCVVRNTILRTFETGEGYFQREAQLPFNIAGKTVEFSLFVSTASLSISGHPMVIVCLEDVTQRKRAEEALRRSKKEWESTFNAMSDWVVLMDVEGRILRTNDIGEEFVNVPVAEMVGQTCCKLVHGSDTHLPNCPMLKMFRTSQRETMELQLPGSRRWLRITVDPVINEKGAVVSAVHIVSDVTERKKAEQERVAAVQERVAAVQERVAAVQERASVIDAMSDALVVINLDGEIMSCNPAHLRMIGHSSANEIVGRHFSELSESFCDPEEDIPRLLGIFKEIIQKGFSEPVEVRVRRTDGKELTVSASASVQRDAMGNPLNVIAILRDITPQKRLQEMEKEAAVTKTAVETIEGMLEGITIMDLDGTIRQVNSEFERRSGYKREEAVGKKAIELGIVSKEENQMIEKEIIPKLMNEGLVRNVETVAMTKDGTRFPILMGWTLIKDAQGTPKSIIVT